MTDRSARERGLRVPSLIAAALIATAFLLPAEPREASGFGLISVLSTGKSAVDANETRKGLEEVHDKLLDRFGEYVDLIVNDGTDQQAEAVRQRTRRNLADIPLIAMDPTYGGAEALLNKAKSAARKFESFLGGAREAVSAAGAKTKVDLRAALAVGDKDRKTYESGTGILGGKPLPTPASAKARPTGSASKPWFKDWVLKQQEKYPHCWGIVDADSDPNDCMAKADAKREAAARASQKAEPEQPGNGKVGWASGDWTAEGTGWSGWDRSDSRYDDEDRESARVGIYALECWGVSGVTAESGLYDLMKGRMARNECPEEDRSRDNSNQGRSDYEAASNCYAIVDANADPSDCGSARAGTQGKGSDGPSDDDYRNALNALEAKEEEQRRLEEQEYQRQARIAAQRRAEDHELERQAQLEVRQNDRAEGERRAWLAEKWRMEGDQRAWQARAEKEREEEKRLAEKRELEEKIARIEANARRQANRQTIYDPEPSGWQGAAEILRQGLEALQESYQRAYGGNDPTARGESSESSSRCSTGWARLADGRGGWRWHYYDGTSCGQR